VANSWWPTSRSISRAQPSDNTRWWRGDWSDAYGRVPREATPKQLRAGASPTMRPYRSGARSQKCRRGRRPRAGVWRRVDGRGRSKFEGSAGPRLRR
jgi:hypothetical protein